MQAVTKGLQRRLQASPIPVHRHVLPVDGGGLPFESGSFDCATITWTLCSVPNPVAGLGEVLRVLRPGAPLLFVEHGRSDSAAVARWQDRLNGVQQVLCCGCNLNRQVDQIIETSGFRIQALQRFNVPHMPRIFGHLYMGRATAPA